MSVRVLKELQIQPQKTPARSAKNESSPDKEALCGSFAPLPSAVAFCGFGQKLLRNELQFYIFLNTIAAVRLEQHFSSCTF